MKFREYINEEVTKTIKIPLTKSEIELIGNIGIYKEKYKLDRTQFNYRYDKNKMSMPFKEKENIKELKKLIKKVE